MSRPFLTLPNPLQQCGFIALLLCFLFLPRVDAQMIEVEGEASVLENDLVKSRFQYEAEAISMAKEDAVNRAFGSSVLSNYERYTITEMQGRSVAFNRDIRGNYLNTFPNGIWVEDKAITCKEEKDEQGNIWLSCKVSGYARKIESARVRFVACTLDGTDPNINRTETFVQKEKGYLYFKSPENGYLVIFHDDMKLVQRCLPYTAFSDNFMRIEANREYIFFSEKHADYLEDKLKTDGILFTAEMPLEYNRFYILFSPEPLSGYLLDPSKKLEDGSRLFKSMERKDFFDWLQENRIRNKDLQVQIIAVTVRQ